MLPAHAAGREQHGSVPDRRDQPADRETPALRTRHVRQQQGGSTDHRGGAAFRAVAVPVRGRPDPHRRPVAREGDGPGDRCGAGPRPEHGRPGDPPQPAPGQRGLPPARGPGPRGCPSASPPSARTARTAPACAIPETRRSRAWSCRSGPHQQLAEERLRQALDDTGLNTTGFTTRTRVIADRAEAERSALTGSPTILIDGRDPFAEPAATPSFSCRMRALGESRTDVEALEARADLTTTRPLVFSEQRAGGMDRRQYTGRCSPWRIPEGQPAAPVRRPISAVNAPM